MHWRVLRWWPHREEGRRGQLGDWLARERGGGELAHQPVRHSLWEQGPLGAHNGVLFGCLDGEVGALQQRKAVYDGERRLFDGSDSCWSCSDSDSGSEAVPKLGIGPPTLGGAVVVAARGGELVGEGHGPLQHDGRAPAMLGKRVQRGESPLYPRGLAPKRVGAVVVAAQGGELEGEAQGPLQSDGMQGTSSAWGEGAERGGPTVPKGAGTEEGEGRGHGQGWSRR